MNAPILWIFFPIAIAIILWFIQQKRKLTYWLSSGICFSLGLIALFQNIGSVLKIGPISINVSSTQTILGRSFILENSDRIFLVFIYFTLTFWFLGSLVAGTPSKFIPLSMAVASLLTAGLAVEPFLYSAILIELAIIVSLPLVITRSRPIGKGVLRYLIFPSLAMPFILLAGWILSGVQTSLSDLNQLYLAAFFLGLGFAFWLGVFPFHMWIPEFSSESDSYINGFLLSILPIAFLLIILDFINGLAWLKDATFLVSILRISGTLMVATGGIWAAMQSDLKRIFGFAVIFESGFALLCVSLRSELGNELFYLSITSRAICLAVWSFVLNMFQKNGVDTTFENLKGKINVFPITSAALLISMFSCAGLPLLAAFPIRTTLLANFSSEPILIFWVLLGMLSMLFAACNALRILTKSDHVPWTVGESTIQIMFTSFGILALILIGFFPSVFLKGVWITISKILTLK